MDATTFRRYDRHVVLNQPPLSMLDHEALASALVEPAALEHQAYEEEIAGILANGRVVRDLTELIALHGREASSEARVSCSSCSSGALVVYYAAGLSARDKNVEGRINAHSPWKPISNFFGLWHEPRRGQHNAMHRFHYGGQCVLLVDAASPYAAAHMPADLEPLQGQVFGRALWKRMQLSGSMPA
jgi:hypothetical protein